MKFTSFYFLVCMVFLSCSSGKSSQKTIRENAESENEIQYLALGDSYTIGESVDPNYRWPVLLAEELQRKGYDVAQPTIIAKTGWRTDNLLDSLNASSIEKQYDMVSLLIGVNNQYQGAPIKNFEEELKILLEKSIAYCTKGKEGVFMLSIPDYSVTPFGKRSNLKNIAGEIKRYNYISREIAKEFGIPFYDITRYSQMADEDRSLVANDKLHPSARMYKIWVDKITENVISDIIK